MSNYEIWGVYIHVPFCAARCSYCDFCTYSGKDWYIDTYFKALRDELLLFWKDEPHSFVRSDRRADTVFFGGGTPSFVDETYVRDALKSIPCADGDLFECTIEANPGTLSYDKLLAYRMMGINRLSLGVQSTHERHLNILSRISSADDFYKSVKLAGKAGISNISVDLIFGIPSQSVNEWAQTLETVVSLGIRHISCYSLSIEEGTRLHSAIGRGELPAPDEDKDREMYHLAQSFLESAGLLQYELSNFAVPGFECRHNLKYWTGARYRGFGAAAHSYDILSRFSNPCGLEEYARSAGVLNAQSREIITASEREKEFIILRLRLSRGFSEYEFCREFGHGFYEKYVETIDRLKKEGLLEVSIDDHSNMFFRLTALGMDLANRVFIEFI